MDRSELEQLLFRQKQAFKREVPGYERRIEALRKLSSILEEHQEELIHAVARDFGWRSHDETLLLEIYPLQDEIRHAIKNLKSWMKSRRVSGSWFLYPAKAFYQYQPKGCVGIMGAWNYQLMLCLSPMIDALAAGNHILLKPSEIAPHSAGLLKRLLNANFDEAYVSCVTGDADTARNFSALGFDHLFFTGSTTTGKKVMEAAAPNLTPVTLELGGKSPAIIHPSYSVERAVKRILTGKLFNAGQTCVAPDYLMCPESLNTQIEEQARNFMQQHFQELLDAGQYTWIINDKHYERLQSLLKDAEEKGAKLVPLWDSEPEDRQFFPYLIFGVQEDMRIMQEEIFGPLLPVLNIESLSGWISYVESNPRPLALYYFDSNKKRIRRMLQETNSGGVTINDTIYHLAQHNLPFGGNGDSGMGHYHGFDGFETFSKKKAVMKQYSFAPTDFLRPPFTGVKKTLLRKLGSFLKA
ncbi:coniferyl aldehyde dehydrogenase [Christiangramia flava]|uniref:Aldehyde dehydrogenase n=1 Tax=Christiangramia flava JLT2011 TaxID=1229726 RepID=A0A1L7I7K8_9FLAO|nr:coniferyl aldehyde dehydrogenase [Christiangramia flava]APU69576.1 Aldehyde dehydrogenase [Christiangramia flava JLT2011]OSS39392.1 Aldehyde dehydrogenase [Christiangramia flava JLT2011]